MVREKYGSDYIGNVEASRGNLHEYLAMTLYYTEEEKLKIDMRNYLDEMISEFPHILPDKVKCLWTEKIFKVDNEERSWEMKRGQYFINLR